MKVNEIHQTEPVNGKTIAERIENVIDRRKGRGKYVGKGHLDAIKEKKVFFTKLLKHLTDYQAFRKNVLEQIEKNKGEFYEMSLKDSEFQDNVINSLPDKAIDSVQRAIAECLKFEKRFDREIKTMKTVKCNNSVEISDYYIDNSYFYIVMEKCDGDLFDLLKNKKMLS